MFLSLHLCHPGPLPPLNPLLFLVILNRVKSDRFSHSSPRSLRLLFSSQIQSFLCPSMLQHSKHTNTNEPLGGAGGGGAPNTPCGQVHIRSAILRKSPIGGNLPQFLPHPVIPSQVKLAVCSVPASIVQSCCPFTVGASEEPIRLAVERKSEKVWHRYVDLPPLSCSFIYTLLYTHIQRYTPMRGTRKRVALGDGGLGERRMLAARGPDPSPGSNAPLTLPLMC